MIWKRNKKSAQNSQSILIIGGRDFYEFLKPILNKADYNVSWIDNVEEAVQDVRRRCPDIAVVSAVIDGKTSVRICSGLKRNDITKGIPVLVIAGQNDGANIMEFFAEEIDGYMIKPFSPGKLIEQIETLIS